MSRKLLVDEAVELENHVVHLKLFPSAPGTAIVFEAIHGTIDAIGPNKRPSGEKFYLENGFNLVNVIPRWKTFYRTPDIILFLAQLSEAGVLDSYPKIVTVGSSMGGFGAASFARLMKADCTLAIAPFSTLNLDLAPWEDRWPEQTAELDWSGPLSDAATEITAAPNAFLIYDPLDGKDRAHVKRLHTARAAAGQKTMMLRYPGGGHEVAKPLAWLGMMKQLSTAAFHGGFDPTAFYKRARMRRRLGYYYRTLLEFERVSHSKMFREIVTARAAAAEAAPDFIPEVKGAPIKSLKQIPWALMADRSAINAAT